MARVGDELGFQLAGKFRFDTCRVLSRTGAMTKHCVAEKRGVLVHQRAVFFAAQRPADHLTATWLLIYLAINLGGIE